MVRITKFTSKKFTQGNTVMGLLLSGALLASVPAVAAEPPALAETIEMSPAVATALNGVIAAMDAQKYDEARAALQQLRATQQDMSDYEKFRMLQLSASLNTLSQQYAEAAADYEAMLQLDTLDAAERLATANLAGQLHMQLGDWSRGLEHLLAVNTLQGGNDSETLYRIAFAYGQLGQASAALPFMEQRLALAGAAASEEDYSNLALLYMNAGDNAKAITTYEKLLEIAPDTAKREAVSSNLAALYIKVGNNAKAQSRLRQLLREYPGSASAPVWRQSLAALGG